MRTFIYLTNETWMRLRELHTAIVLGEKKSLWLTHGLFAVDNPLDNAYFSLWGENWWKSWLLIIKYFCFLPQGFLWINVLFSSLSLHETAGSFFRLNLWFPTWFQMCIVNNQAVSPREFEYIWYMVAEELHGLSRQGRVLAGGWWTPRVSQQAADLLQGKKKKIKKSLEW